MARCPANGHPALAIADIDLDSQDPDISIAVRHARTDAISRIKKLEHVSSDDKTRAEKDVQKHTDDHIKQIDGLIHSKEAEIMEV